MATYTVGSDDIITAGDIARDLRAAIRFYGIVAVEENSSEGRRTGRLAAYVRPVWRRGLLVLEFPTGGQSPQSFQTVGDAASWLAAVAGW